MTDRIKINLFASAYVKTTGETYETESVVLSIAGEQFSIPLDTLSRSARRSIVTFALLQEANQ